MKINTEKISDLIDKISDEVCIKLNCYDCPAWDLENYRCNLEKIRRGFFQKYGDKDGKIR